MYQVEFKYNGINTIIQCDQDEKMKDIVTNFANKIQRNKNKIYFSYDGKEGNQFNEELSCIQMANSIDKERKKIIVLVNDIIKEIEEEKYKILSKNIICPKCGEIAKIKIKDYKITIYDCMNGHKTNII